MRAWKWAGGAFSCGVLALAAAALAVWEKPELLLNEHAVRFALRYAGRGVEADWGSFRWTFRKEGGWDKSTRLEIDQLCLKLPGQGISGCVPRLELEFSFSLKGFRPALTRIGTLHLEVSEARGALADGAPSTNTLPDLRLSPFPDLLSGVIGSVFRADVLLKVGRVEIATGDGPPWIVSLTLRKLAGDDPRFTLLATAAKGEGTRLRIAGDARLASGSLALRGDASGSLLGWRIRLPLRASWREELALAGALTLSRSGESRRTPLSLRWGARRLALSAGRYVLPGLLPGRRVALSDCRFASALDAKEGYPARSEVDCGLAVEPFRKDAVPPSFRAALHAEARLAPKNRRLMAVEADFTEMSKDPLLVSSVEFHGKAELRPGARLSDDPSLSLAAAFHVPSLARWRALLDRTPYAIPAPFRVLDGPADLQVKLAHADRKELVANAYLTTDFSAGRQKVATKHSLQVRVANPWSEARGIHVHDDSELTDVALEAPPLSIEAPPQLMLDRRFSRRKLTDAAPGATAFTYDAEVRTKAPVRIRTNLVQNEIPVALDLREAAGGSLAGKIEIQPMPISVFHKNADVKFVTFAFHPGARAAEVKGELDYKNSDALIKILLSGTTDKPRVEFDSDPPLSRQQIIAVLLFNKSVDDLDDTEASSTGSFSQATADGALGLFSLFFLSGTPIESVSYDPTSQTYSARVKIGAKTTLSVGSDFNGEQQFALQRHLGGRFTVRTELRDQEGEPNSLLTLLEWFRRF